MAYTRPILLVDDEKGNLDLLGAVLDEAGLTTLTLSDPMKVLDKLSSEPVDIVITDIHMPGMTGLELLAKIKAEEGRLARKILVFVVTAFSDSLKAVQALDGGAFCYLTKPLNMRGLLLHLRRAINEISPGAGATVNLQGLKPCPTAAKPVSDAPPPGDGPAPKTDQVLSVLQFPLDAMSILNHAPAKAGVITLRDDQGLPLYVEWAENMRRRLTRFASHDAGDTELTSRAKYFEYCQSAVPDFAACIFDKLVNETGRFPLCQPKAPQGSKYFGMEKPSSGEADRFDGLVTGYGDGSDDATIAQVRALLEEKPDNRGLLEWYAFLLYTSGQYDEAAAQYEDLISCGDARSIDFFYLGNALYKANRSVDAVQAWYLAVQMDPDSKVGKKAAERIEQVNAGRKI